MENLHRGARTDCERLIERLTDSAVFAREIADWDCVSNLFRERLLKLAAEMENGREDIYRALGQ